MKKIFLLMSIGLALACPSHAYEPYSMPPNDLSSSEIWAPKPGGGNETRRLRIVDLGMIYCRGFEDGHLGDVHAPGQPDKKTGQVLYDIDVDGNPATKDSVSTFPFSMTTPISPVVPRWDDTMPSARYYGGWYCEFSNRQKPAMTEQQINACETPNVRQPANNWAFHQLKHKKNAGIRSHATWIWKKEDFLHGGDEGKVSFDENSQIALYRQRYWSGFEGVRFVVQDKGLFYLSEKVFKDWHGPPGGMSAWGLDVCSPSETKWALWDVKEGDLDISLDPEAVFKPQTFTDVQAVGWLLFKDTLDDATTACKWECFECVANVTRKTVPSGFLDMKKVDDVWFSTTEIPYQVWKQIHRWTHAVPQWVLKGGEPFIFDSDGDMGSMDFSAADSTRHGQKHSQREPVTDVTLYDALAWCNAMSMLEGRELVYYTDAEFETPFRHVIQSSWLKDPKAHERPTIYIKWAADGFRLPTPSEWAKASAGASPVMAGSKTMPVGKGSVNANGLYDMRGNVWELVWTYGDRLEPEPKAITAMGGAFDYDGADPLAVSSSPYGSTPYDGHYNIGFRVVRRATGGARVSSDLSVGAKKLAWTFGPKTRCASYAPSSVEIDLTNIPEGSMGDFQMSSFEAGTREVSFAEWMAVLNWAEANGYDFDHDGDMGSMDFKLYINEHSPGEPVTDLSLQDMCAWANAYSEMKDRPPVYYLDKAKTTVYRKVLKYRPLQMRAREMRSDLPSEHPDKPKLDIYGAIPFDMPGLNLAMKWNSDGFRLPTVAEWAYAYGGGSTANYPWGETFDLADEHAWFFGNSKMRTHAVAQKKPNGFGLYDMAGNALELTSDSVVKYGKILRGITANPIFTYNITEGPSKWRSTFAKVGFHYDHHEAFQREVIRGPMSANKGGDQPSFGGGYPGWGWADTGFRIMAAGKDTYHPDGIDPDYKPTNATPIDLNRRPDKGDVK